jgi:hypothetical protein
MTRPSWLNWHTCAQAAATSVQILNLVGKVAPPKYQPAVMVGLSFAQWALGTIAHYQQPPK